MPDPVLELDRVELVRAGRQVLGPTTLTVGAGERWVVLGPNGAGKSTLLRLASTYELPTRGSVTVLGDQVGRTPVEALRRRIGVTSSHLERLVDHRMEVRTAVGTGFDGHLIGWRMVLSETRWQAVDEVIDRLGLRARAGHPLEVLSEGERRRVQLARALVRRPELLLLDEPTAGLDIAGREGLVAALADLYDDPDLRASVLVTHHLEEVPPGTTHAALMCSGRVVAAGPLGEVLTGPRLSSVFGLDIEVSTAGGRWQARAAATRGAPADLHPE